MNIERSKCNKRNRRLVESINKGSSFEFTVAFASAGLTHISSRPNRFVIEGEFIHTRTQNIHDVDGDELSAHINGTFNTYSVARQIAHIWLI